MARVNNRHRQTHERLHRQRAACEDRIRCAKDTGLRNLPFHAFQMNAAWLELVLLAQDLLRWTQRLLLTDTVGRPSSRRPPLIGSAAYGARGL